MRSSIRQTNRARIRTANQCPSELEKMTPILGEGRRSCVRLMLLPAEQSHVGMRGRRYHLILGEWKPFVRIAVQFLRMCSPYQTNVLIFYARLNLSEVATSCYRYPIYVNAPFGSFFLINVSHFLLTQRWENWLVKAKLRGHVHRHSSELSPSSDQFWINE